jgi:hypothetical protein
MHLLALLACSADLKPGREALTLTVESPTYGEYVGVGPVVVEGVVVPADAQLLVNRTPVRPDAEGRFRAELTFPEGDRALVADIFAMDGEQRQHVRVPVFDAEDPRATDPGAVNGLLTPSGLDGIEPLIEEQVDALGWEEQLLATLPALETGVVDLVPVSVESDGVDVDLQPGIGDVGLLVTLEGVRITTDVTVVGYTFPLAITTSVTLGARATPQVDAEGYVALVLTGAEVAFTDPGFAAVGFELPDFLADLLLDPIAQLLTYVADGLGDALIGQLPALDLGGPFAFELDLLGTPLAARLVDVGASLDGIDLGVTIGAGAPAPATMPSGLAPLLPRTPSGADYQLGFAVHEGILNTLVDEAIGGFLDIDLPLSGAPAQVFGAGIAGLPGGDELPDDIDGYCIGLHAGDARVVRFEEGVGAPLARAWLPDVTVDLELLRDGTCDPWLSAAVVATLDLTVRGTELSAALDVRDVQVQSYLADDARWDETGAAMEGLVEGLAGLLAGQLSFDLGDALGGSLGGLPTAPTLVAVEPLGDDGRWGIYLDIFPR